MFEAIEQDSGFLAAVRFDEANDHIPALFAQLASGQQHGVGLADAGRGAEKNLQLATPGTSFLFLEAV